MTYTLCARCRDRDAEHIETLGSIEEASFRLLLKFHKETDCGKRLGDHWAECNGLVDAIGWESWETWLAIVDRAP